MNVTTPQIWTELCASQELDEGEMKAFEVQDQRVALYRYQGMVYATDNVCSHAFALLTDGWLDGQFVECPLHGAQFDITTGAPQSGPADCAIAVFKTQEVDGSISVLLTPMRRTPSIYKGKIQSPGGAPKT
jgi:nitrite reductase/ring-hydroxylating ferredoxin subunit